MVLFDETNLRSTLESMVNEWESVLDPDRIRLEEEGFVRDPVHGHVHLNGLDFAILDLPPLQRLRQISQLSFVDRVYPGANHTRFEHSFGAATTCGRIMTALSRKHHRQVDEDDVWTVKVSGYFHDTGHLPFSHALEPLFERFAGERASELGMTDAKPHEVFSYYLLNTDYVKRAFERINDQLRKRNLPKNVPRVQLDHSKILKIISNIRSDKSISTSDKYMLDIVHGYSDADRIDYLLRDAYYTGVPHGEIDVERLIETFCITSRGKTTHLGIEDKGIQAMEALYVSRDLMYSTVYLHHAARIAEAMVLRGAHYAIAEDRISNPFDLLALSDPMLLNRMRTWGHPAQDISSRLVYRRFLKRCIVFKITDLAGKGQTLQGLKPGLPLPKIKRSLLRGVDGLNKRLRDWKDRVSLEEAISRDALPNRFRRGYLVVDSPGLALPNDDLEEEEYPTVQTRAGIKSLIELSPIVRSIERDGKTFGRSVLVAGPQGYEHRIVKSFKEHVSAQFQLGVVGGQTFP